MRAMAKKKPKTPSNTIVDNRRARFDYALLDTFEAGVALTGWEVKALRAGKVQLTDSYVLIKDGEAFLLDANKTLGAPAQLERDADRLARWRARADGIRLCESDIKPADRYLMERFVRCSVELEGKCQAQGNHRVFNPARIRPGTHVPSLRVLSLVSLPTPEPVPILGWIHAFVHALAVVRFLQPLTAWQ